MSSTYSTNLAIELIGSGEQAGNWGSTTNTNLGTLIEQAISGYTTYSCTGGTDTLTMTNGADATARNMYIQLSGTGGGTLVVPGTYPNANKKLYFIYNSTSSAITVKVSGQTGVSVPAAAKIALVCNGSDIVTAENYMVSATLPNATLASPTLTGTPIAPTASVGTSTTQIATTAFVQSAIVAAYPVGSIYMSTVATNPATLFGFGTWVAYGQGRMPISADGTYTAGSIGGSATTTLIEANLPSHSHSATFTGTALGTHQHYVGSNDSRTEAGGDPVQEFIRSYNEGNGPKAYTDPLSAGTPAGSVSVGNTGSGTAATTISPYIAVYMWNRTV
jgi:microcystin-dependent protein